MLHVAAFGVEAGQVQHHFFGIGIHGLRGLEDLFGLLGIVLYGVKLTQNHALLDILGFQRDNLLVFGNCLLQHIAGGAATVAFCPSLNVRR